MISKKHRFQNVSDLAILGRLHRSQDIRTINRFSFFEAVNVKNGHRYRLELANDDIVCSCPDSSRGFCCKHEIAVARDLVLFHPEGP